MKAIVLIILAMFCGLLIAEISPFALVGEGNYAGKLATYASGDTIVFVTKTFSPNSLEYRFSYDGGVTWETYHWGGFEQNFIYPESAPTLSYTYNEALVSFIQGYFNKICASYHGNPLSYYGYPFQQIFDVMPQTFDQSPYLEKVNGQLKRFSLDTPYPPKSMYGDQQAINQCYDPDDPEEYLAPFYFTNKELNPLGEPSPFTGSDVINGIVRSNSDIWIRQTTGAHQGWPTFLAPVVTSGAVRVYPDGGTTYPYTQVFRGGLIENAAPLPLLNEIPSNETSIIVGPPVFSPNNIVMVTVNGNSYTAMLGTISNPRHVITDVWPNYPYGTEVEPSFRNYFTVCDTMWTALPPGTCSDNTMRVNSKLWIRGNFSGKQTWCSPDSIYIIGDITLTNTVPGTDPYPNNTLDSVSLISEESILLKYGYKDPVDSLRYHPLCRADSDPIYIYASLYALRDGMLNSGKDGIFTFEYQRPHGSIPATTINSAAMGDTLFDWIDLHRNRWPQTSSQPWPSSIDYPWYNPLWPERAPYLERGTIQLWGSVTQRMRGFLHRNYNDFPATGLWNIPNGYFGGSSTPTANTIQLYQNPNVSVTLQTQNFPGSAGYGTGYKKDFRWDSRRRLSDGWDESNSKSVWGVGLNLSNNNSTYPNSISFESYYRKAYLRVPHDKCFARKGERAYYSINDQLIYADLDVVTDISTSTNGDGIIRSIALSPDSSPLVYQLAEVDSTFSMTVKDINAVSGTVAFETSFPVPTMINDVCVLPNGRRLVARFENPGTISLWEITPQNVMNPMENWQMDAGLLPSADRLKTSRLYMMPSDNDGVEVFFYVPADTAIPNSNGALYHAHAGFPVSNEDYSVPSVPAIRFTAYPNPMRDELKLNVENAKASSLSIDVYNIRGQLVHRIPLANQADSAKIECTWNGKDGNNHRVANGIYLLRLVANNKVVTTKRICRY